MTVREQASADFKDILEDAENGLGTEFVLINKEGVEYPLTGDYGDIGYLINSATGEATQGRTIQAAYVIESLRQQTPEVPCRGWQFRTMDFNKKEIKLFVIRYEPDATVGVARLRLSLSLKE